MLLCSFACHMVLLKRRKRFWSSFPISGSVVKLGFLLLHLGDGGREGGGWGGGGGGGGAC